MAENTREIRTKDNRTDKNLMQLKKEKYYCK